VSIVAVSALPLLRRLLELAGGPAESGYVLVIEGAGLEDLPERLKTSKADYAVHRVGTEIGLRHLLWKARGAPLIAVLPEALAHRVQKAPDLMRRARNQRVHALAANDVLELLLGVRVVGADAPHMQELALDHVEQIGTALSAQTLPTVVDRRLLTELLVDASVGEAVRSRSAGELLADWVQEPPTWSANVGRLVRDALPTLHGDDGRLLAWALLEPEQRPRALVLHGAVLSVTGEQLPKAAWGPLWQAATEAPIEMDRRILRRHLCRLAEDALAALGEASAPLLAEADRLGRSSLTPSELATSRVLPLAFADRCHALAEGAAAGKAIPAEEMAWLASHRAAGMHKADLAVLEEIARLSRYLDKPSAPQASVLEQVRGWQRDGAFADLAAMQLRRALAGSAHHHTQADAVLARVRARRDAENRHFAETLAVGYEAALHHAGVVPLHRLWKRVVAPVWQSDPDAALYLVVLDGCSYPVFLELLHALSQDGSFPMGAPPDRDGHVNGLPALAPLPTVTSHARGAIFLGELPQDPLVAETVFRDQEETKTDKARFNQNAALAGRSRRLFLKGDLADAGQALLHALEDPSVAVVAAVFNAVDDQIGSANTGAVLRLRPEDIMGFKPSLRAALKAGRRVLLTADHGHSPFLSKGHRVGAGKTPRHVSLAAADRAPEGFMEIDVGALGGTPERRAYAWRSGAYLGNPQVGFHGGCALEEMAVPLAWIERDGLPADEPSWWFGHGAPSAQAVRESEVPPAPPLVTPQPSDSIADAPRTAAQRKRQMSLFDPADRAGSLGLATEVLDGLSDQEKAVLVLLKDNGTARTNELAAQLGKQPGRINGLMRKLRRTLHASGLVLFSDEGLPGGETLYRWQAPPPADGAS
jgi:hypothetical protein